MKIDILSLFPGYFRGPFDESMVKRARNKGILDIRLTDIRDFATDRHRKVDDRPYGGGPGMVMMPGPTVAAIRHVKTEQSHAVYLSPQGKTLNAKISRELACKSHLILLCGHYEGIDRRISDLEIDEEISIGDYVLLSGCSAAVVLVESVVRFIPGVLGDELSAEEDSFEKGKLEYDQYTRPEVFEDLKVPSVLLSGNHRKINDWRSGRAEKNTRERRPDLFEDAGNRKD